MAANLPAHHRALVLGDEGLQVRDAPTPRAELGNAIVKVDAASVLSYMREVYSGERQYPFPKPLVCGVSAIGRIAALGPDASSLQIGQLVYIDCVIHGRDDLDTIFLTALHEGFSDGSRKLMREIWRDGYFAEYAKVPLENCIGLNEAKLCGTLGYSIEDLAYMCYLLVPYGGLRDIRLEAGETVVVCPATGGYGGAGVQVAVAMGARVIAFGRNEAELARLKAQVLRGSPTADIEVVKMTGDEMADAATLKTHGPIDAVLDFAPPQAAKSAHVRSAAWALRRAGRISLMGFNENPMVPTVTGRNISLHGKLMYERSDIVHFVKLLDSGRFPRSKDFVENKAYSLVESRSMLDEAAKFMGIARHVILRL